MSYNPPPRLDDNQFAAFVKFFIDAARTYKQEVRLLDRIYGRPGDTLEVVLTQPTPAEFEKPIKIKAEIFVVFNERTERYDVAPSPVHVGTPYRFVVLSSTTDHWHDEVVGGESSELNEFFTSFLSGPAADPRQLSLQAARRRQEYFERVLPFVGEERFKEKKDDSLVKTLRGEPATKVAVLVGAFSLFGSLADHPVGPVCGLVHFLAYVFLLVAGFYNLQKAAEGRGSYVLPSKQIAAGAVIGALGMACHVVTGQTF